ncbi:glycosyltransferase family 2 protein [Agromyces badenianii]|uniref:Glycosyltransferase family 2 protein n=1 Tax=Agromyces badenianii TaxID=2080742 RepID=A0A2S0WX24_9MICO|nr:glycosyltransferase family 2 protein [Agromyces badenianii]AWB95897.1 glycosyltransferase family 2 protein [Agromyces badenianii]
MADTVSVSVALCTFNGSRFIREQIRSILAQSVLPDEIVVSDDASVDDTIDVIVDEHARWSREAETPVRLHIHRNDVSLGVTANFASAMLRCSGDLIALSDQDDVWHPDRLERVIAEFDGRPDVLLVHSDARIVDGTGVPDGTGLFSTLGLSAAERRAVAEGRPFAALMRRNFVTGATTMIRRELVERARPFPASWVHDEWLAVVAAATGSLVLLDEQLIDYRQHGGNQIGASSLTPAGRLARLTTPRTERNTRLRVRAGELQTRMPRLSPRPSDDDIALAAAKAEHELVRDCLPGRRLRRIAPVWREWRTGRYRSCGLGLQDVLRDLVQPE